MIPPTQDMRDSLAALTVTEVDDESVVSEDSVVSSRISRHLPDGNEMAPEKAIILEQAAGAPISISSLISRIAKELHGAGHTHSAPKSIYQVPLARKVLALATVLSRYVGDHNRALNSLFNAIVPTRISQWAIVSNSETGNGQCRFGDFIYETFAVEEMLRRCERAGGWLLDDDVEQLRGKLSLLRVTDAVKTIRVNDILPPGSVNDKREGQRILRIVDAYFRDIAVAEQQRFLDDLDRQQELYGAVGKYTLSAESLRNIESFTRWITIFDRKERKRGWVLQRSPTVTFTMPEPAMLSDCHIAVIKSLKLDDWGQKPLDHSIEQFCHFLAVSQFHETKGKLEEALLYVVFALDLLLGAEAGESLTMALADRVALLTHIALNRTRDRITKLVRRCYEMRSKYVHRGEKGKRDEVPDLMQEIGQVYRAVLGAACYARSQPWAQSDDVIRLWHGRIDILLAKQKAEMEWDESDMNGLGLKRIRVDREHEVGVCVDFGG